MTVEQALNNNYDREVTIYKSTKSCPSRNDLDREVRRIIKDTKTEFICEVY